MSRSGIYMLYLNVCISSKLNELHKLNYVPHEIKDNLERWHKLPLSLIDWKFSIKMNISLQSIICFQWTLLPHPLDGSPLSAFAKFYYNCQKAVTKLSNHSNQINILEDFEAQIHIIVSYHIFYVFNIGQVTSTNYD